MKFLQTFALSLAMIFAANVNTQLPKTDPLAAQMAGAIAHSKQKSVIVFDFWGRDNKLNGLGQYLAQNFSMALAKAAPSVEVLDRAKISAACAGRGLSLSVLSDVSTAIWIGRELGAQAVIVGRLENDADVLDMTLTSYRTRDLKQFAGFRTTALMSVEMRSLLNKEVKYLAIPTGVVPLAGKGGYTFPKCLHCPPALYSQEAADEKLSGIVVLDAIIGKDGKAHEISVGKGLPFGLTKQALEAVSQWTFKPASDAEGTPMAVRQVIEVNFHLY
jgi:TonB family protein